MTYDLLHTLPVQRVQPVFAWFPFGRSLLDHSSAPNVLTQAGDPKWQRLNGVDTISGPTSGDHFTAPHSSSLAVSALSCFWWGDIIQGPNHSIIRKLGTAGRYQVYSGAGSINYYDGTTVSQFVGDINHASSMAAVVESGQKARFLRNGVFFGLGNNAVTVPATDGVFYVGSGGPLMGYVSGVLLYDAVLTDGEVADTHAVIESLASPLLAADRRYWLGHSTLPNGPAGGVVGAWALGDVTNNESPDRSGGNNTASLVGACAPVNTEAGRALGFDGVTGCVNLGNASEIRFDSGSDFSVSMWVRPDSIAGVQYLVDNFDVNDDGWAVRLVSGVPWISINTIDVKAASALAVGQWALLSFVCDRSGNGQAYINGEASGATVDISGQVISTTSDIYIGCFDGTSSHFVGQALALVIQDRVLSIAEIKADYLKLARRVMYDLTLDYIRPTVRTYVVGEELPGTGLRIITGSFSIPEDSDGRFIECVTNGKLRAQLPGADNFHTDAFDATGATLAKNATNIEIDAVAGDTVRTVLLTLGVP